MAALLVTGMSGTGKSTVLGELARRGHRVVDTDADEWSEWVLDEVGEPDWVWRLDAVAGLLDAHLGDGHLFVAGCKTNQAALYPRFDRVVVLVAPADTLLARVAVRTTNPYGTRPEDRARILRDLEQVQPRLVRTASDVLDATRPARELADALESLAAEVSTT